MPATRSNPLEIRRPRAAIGALAALAAGALVAVSFAGCGLADPAGLDGRQGRLRPPLAIPPLAPSGVDSDGTRVSADARPGRRVLPGAPSDTWGFNGTYLGPTLRAEARRDVAVDVANELDAPTTVHWHGMHLPAAMDGGRTRWSSPGDVDARWDIDQPAATLWYHPHPHGETEEQVARGLAGMFLVQTTPRRRSRCPASTGWTTCRSSCRTSLLGRRRARGRRRRLRGGSATAARERHARPLPRRARRVVRLRLLNASTARGYDSHADGREFAQIASDGGLLEAPSS